MTNQTAELWFYTMALSFFKEVSAITMFFIFMACIGIGLCGYIIGSSVEYKRKSDMTNLEAEKLRDTIRYLNSYIDFLQIELVEERRSKIHVTVNDSREEDGYED